MFALEVKIEVPLPVKAAPNATAPVVVTLVAPVTLNVCPADWVKEAAVISRAARETLDVVPTAPAAVTFKDCVAPKVARLRAVAPLFRRIVPEPVPVRRVTALVPALKSADPPDARLIVNAGVVTEPEAFSEIPPAPAVSETVGPETAPLTAMVPAAAESVLAPVPTSDPPAIEIFPDVLVRIAAPALERAAPIDMLPLEVVIAVVPPAVKLWVAACANEVPVSERLLRLVAAAVVIAPAAVTVRF